MKDTLDNHTVDPVTPAKRPRGRPPLDGAKTPAQRQKEHRDRLRASGEASLTVTLPLELLEALDKFVEYKDMSKSDAVARILRDRLLRKR